jgi:hypothetical protein
MTQQEFYEFRTNVEGSAESFANQPDGSTIITCTDGVRVLVSPDGASRVIDRPKRPEAGFYGTDMETFLVDCQGIIWLVQSPDTDRFERIASLPADAVLLSDLICNDIEIPVEADYPCTETEAK